MTLEERAQDIVAEIKCGCNCRDGFLDEIKRLALWHLHSAYNDGATYMSDFIKDKLNFINSGLEK